MPKQFCQSTRSERLLELMAQQEGINIDLGINASGVLQSMSYAEFLSDLTHPIVSTTRPNIAPS